MALALLCLHELFAGLCTLRHPKVTADDRTLCHRDAPQYGGVAIYDDIVFEYRMTGYALDGIPVVVERETLGTQRHALIQFHIIADDRSIVKWWPMVAAGWISIPVSLCAISVMIRGMRGTPSNNSSWAMR